MEIAAKYSAAREAQLSRAAEVQDRVAEAFARRCQDEVTAHVLAGLTLSALSLAYRVWFSEGKKDIASAVQHVFAEFSIVICGETPADTRASKEEVPRRATKQVRK